MSAPLPLAAVLLGCRAEEGAATGSVVVRFEPEQPALGALPFPSDLFRTRDGALSLGPFPNPRDGTEGFEAIEALLSGRQGVCGTCALRFGLRGGSPVEIEATEPSLRDPVAVIDLQTGELLSLDVSWDPELGLLSARPARGQLMRAGHRHVAFTTSALEGEDGLPVAADVGFLRAAAGLGPAAALVREALGALSEAGVDISTVSALSAFTPEDPARDIQQIRALIEARPPAAASLDRVFVGGALDELLGVPSEDRPGIDVPPLQGQQGDRSLRHQTTRAVVTGFFPAPRLLQGQGLDLGLLTRDGAGEITSLVDDLVPFVLIVPEHEPGVPLPVLVTHHGFNASRATALALADTAGLAGYAVLGIDAYQHGARAPSARDELLAMRGDVPGSDGFYETSELDVSGRVFGMLGAEPGLSMFPGYPLAAFTQFAADALAAIALARQGDLSALRGADPALADLSLDPYAISYLGNSMGAVVGAQVLASGVPLEAVILNVMPGAIVDTLCESGEFRPLSESLLLPAIGVEGVFDEQTRRLALDPTVDLYRWVMEPVDPLALAPSFVREGGPEILVQLAGHDEVAAPPASEAVLAAAGISGIGLFSFAPVRPYDPQERSLAERFDGAMHGMMEVSSQLSTYEEPLLPPLTERQSPQILVNPIEDVHQQITERLSDLRAR